MLYFIIPFRSENSSGDFAKVSLLLKRTLASICNQTCDEFRALVICHEKPYGITHHPKVEYVSVPFEPPPASAMDLPLEDRLFAFRSDKGRKLTMGLGIARNRATDYVMFVDADDLVNRRIAQLCKEISHPNGWLIDRGYRMDERTPWIAYRRKRFNYECGSSYILRTAKAPFPEHPDYSLDMNDHYTRMYELHAHVGENMARSGFPLAICPFYGAVYYCNDQAMYSKDFRRRDGLVRNIMRAMIKGRIITGSFAREFGISTTPLLLDSSRDGSDARLDEGEH